MTCSKCHQLGIIKGHRIGGNPLNDLFNNFYQALFNNLTILSQPSVSQSSTQHSTSLCPETSRVEGRKKQTNSSSTRASSSFGRKSRRDVGFGVYTDIQSGRQVINPGRSSDRVISSGTTLKDASQTNVDLGFKPPGLKWKGKEAITGNQLQQMQQRKKIQIKSKWVP
ncbi:hypothetical protein R3W88_017489 [Solanum pinnatisectum]|uniref:Uncharacterized protein n=1 Tax=Solanum pinnatisectum TaxID=50273 RepID=A0AAV9L0N5_9SOLN|nr:hypothetical protein R3W88_017489 [Solanum pinnatisectum]